jgi:hypothetical protein
VKAEERKKVLDEMREELADQLRIDWDNRLRALNEHYLRACRVAVRTNLRRIRALDAVRELAWRYEELCK